MKSNSKPTMPTTEDLREALAALDTLDEYAASLRSTIEDHLDEIENSDEPEEVTRLESEGPEIHSDFDYLEGGLLDLKDKLGSLA